MEIKKSFFFGNLQSEKTILLLEDGIEMKQFFDENKALEEIVNSVTEKDEQNCFIAVECFTENQIETVKAEGHFVSPEGFTNLALAFSINVGKNSWKTIEEAKAELEPEDFKVYEGKELKGMLVLLFKYKISIIGCFSDTETKEWLETYHKNYDDWKTYRDMFLSDEEKESRASVFSDIAKGLENSIQQNS